MTATAPDVLSVPGLSWSPNGQAALSGPLLAAFRALDAAFLEIASGWRAQDHLFPAFLPVAELDRMDYFQSFPHLATFAATLDDDEGNLDRFRAGPPVQDAAARLSTLAPVRDVLTPAACYHAYVALQGTALSAPTFLTTRNRCFRRETHYLPLQRQSGFSMRELVCLGTPGEVEAFLVRTRRSVDDLLAQLGIPVSWEDATDPFFRPVSSPAYLLQKLDPVKQEAVFDGMLAVGSVNLHHDHFGTTFGISRDGRPATSGCVAFGLERWLYALTAVHGPDPTRWPLPGAQP